MLTSAVFELAQQF